MAQQTITEFWSQVKEERAAINAAFEKSKFQKNAGRGNCFITSVKNRQRGMEEGNVVMCTIQLAGQRIAEQSHRISTDDEIQFFMEAQKEARRDIITTERARRTTFSTSVDAEGNAVIPASGVKEKATA